MSMKQLRKNQKRDLRAVRNLSCLLLYHVKISNFQTADQHISCSCITTEETSANQRSFTYNM